MLRHPCDALIFNQCRSPANRQPMAFPDFIPGAQHAQVIRRFGHASLYNFFCFESSLAVPNRQSRSRGCVRAHVEAL